MSAAPKISIRGLKKSFGPKKVLDGLDLDIGVAESVVVIGGSGTGKSVLLKCILGLLHAKSALNLVGVLGVGLLLKAVDKRQERLVVLLKQTATACLASLCRGDECGDAGQSSV